MAARNYTKLALSALTLSLMLSAVGCGGGESGGGGGPSSTTPPPSGEIIDTHVTGSVGDGPVVGARIRVFTNTGATLMQTESSDSADYDLTIKTQGKNYAVRIVADQGIDLVTGAAPDFQLVSAITRPNNRSISNLNPFSTLIYGTARKSGGIDDTSIENARLAVVDRYGFGLDPAIIDDPTGTPIDNANVHVIVKTSETLGEMVRRTRDAMISSGANIDGDVVMGRLAADLTDGWLDGLGASGRDPRTAAVANVASAAVLVQAFANRLHVYGADATGAMDEAIRRVRPQSTVAVADVRIPATALEQAVRALQAAMMVSTDPVVEQALGVVLNAKPGASAETLAAALPAGIDGALEQATLDAAFAAASDIDNINTVGRGEPLDPPDQAEPEPEPEPAPEPDPEPAPEPDPAPDPEPEPDPSPAPANNPPTISGTPDPAAEAGTAWSFQPGAADADGDALTFSVSNKPAWLSFDPATGRLYGTPASGDVGTHLQILISVSDGQDSASLPAFDISVNEPPAPTGFAKVSWTPPTEREDGTALTAIHHYTVYYGMSSANLDQTVTVDGALTSHQVEELAQGTWYFAITATCADGLESAKSAVASKTIG